MLFSIPSLLAVQYISGNEMIKNLAMAIIFPPMVLLICSFINMNLIHNLVIWPLKLIELLGAISPNNEGVYNQWIMLALSVSLGVYSAVVYVFLSYKSNRQNEA